MSKNPRRKGNAQTASSSRAADLLATSEIPLHTLLGLDTTTSEFTESPLIDEFGLNLTPEFRIALKKLTKRDSYTREKAVKELADLLNGSTYEQTKDSFPAFVNSYSKLVTDSSPVIRSTSNAILGKYISTLKKDAGAQLKTVMPFLLISLSDNYGQVARSAESVLNECFAEEKRQLAMKNFAPQAIEISLAFLNKSHKLTQPQKFVEDETDVQRQNRLISQALVAIQKLVDENSQLGQTIYEHFSKPALLTALMNMGVNVKTSVFSLLKKLLEWNAELLLGTKIPSVVISHLDSTDIAICRNAFECFLILATHKKFYETCKIDKAVVPKFVSLVRKKGLHWKVLETSLLPSVALIFENLPDNLREKWLASVLESFFDGNIDEVPVQSWSIAFVEVCKFCFLNSQGSDPFISSILAKVHQFVSTCLKFKNEDAMKQALSLLAWIYSRNDQNETRFLPNFMLDAFKKEFTANLINKLPDSATFIREFFDTYFDTTLAISTIRSPSTPDFLFIECLRKAENVDLETLIKSVPVADIFRRRLAEPNDQETKKSLLLMLCVLIDKKLIVEQLNNIVDVENSEICLALVSISMELTDKLLPDNSRIDIIKRLGKSTSYEELDPLISWICRLNVDSIEDVLKCLFADGIIQEFGWFLKLVSKLIDENKLSASLELFLSSAIVRTLLQESLDIENPIDENLLGEVFEISIKLHANPEETKLLVENYVYQCHSDVELEKIASVIKRLKFANFDRSLLIPTSKELFQTAKSLDKQFDSFILSRNHLLACYAVAPSIPYGINEVSPRQKIDYLARHALFLKNLELLHPSAILYIDFIANLVTSYLENSFVFDKHGVPADIFSKLKEIGLNHERVLEAFIDVFMNAPTEKVSLCILSSLWSHLVKASDQEIQEFIQKTTEIPEIGPQVSSILFSTGINRAAFPLYAEKSLVQLIEDFERASFQFNEDNKEEMFVLLASFVENEKAGCEEWLFMLQRSTDSKLDAQKNALSFAVLRLCAKVVPYLLEIEGPIRDFINCGFITALQSCTEVLEMPTVDRPDTLFVELVTELCLCLFKSYARTIRLNNKDAKYADIVQEWQEFFGSSSVNYITNWLAKLAKKVDLPEFCLKSLCSAIYSMDCDMVLRADVPETNVVDLLVESIEEWKMYHQNLLALLKPVSCLLMSEHPEIQFSAVRVLKCAALDMFQIENRLKKTGSTDGEPAEEEAFPQREENMRLPSLFHIILAKAEDLVASHSEGEAEESPFEKAGICPVFLAWDVLLQFFAEMDVLTRVKYCKAFESNVVNNVMTLLFTKLSDPPVPENGLSIEEYFTTKVNFVELKAYSLNHYLCNLYYRTLITIPALARQWYNTMKDKSRGLAGIVHRYTKDYVSDLVIRREMVNARNNVKLGRLSIKVLAKINEITASYRLEDTSPMILNITLPQDYPLALPAVNNEKAIVSRDIQRRWLLQLTLFLSHQNGSMMDGILQWKRNIDQHLEGVEDCTICMTVVSSTNYQLPKIRCKQCKKKFHGDCLYKWFESSSNSSCPLCRSTFY